MDNHKRALPHCTEALSLNPHSLYGLLSQARKLLDEENYDAAISTLNSAKEAHPSSPLIQPLLQKAHLELKRSKQKDYYKVLSVSRDADDRTVKRAYNRAAKIYHPDKAVAQGIS